MSSGPPPPPKRKNHKPVATYGTGSGIPVPVGSGINVARAISENNQYQSSQTNKLQEHNQFQSAHTHKHSEYSNQQDNYIAPPRKEKEKAAASRKPKNRICVLEDSPDAVIGLGVEIHGDFEYDRLVRIDGKFQGTLFSHNRGDIVIGQNGCIIGDVIVARKMIVEGGHVVGKVVVDELLLRGHTVIKGDVTCKLIEIEGPHVTITGRANIHALAPELVDEYDNIITEIPKKLKKVKKEIYPTPKSPAKHQQAPPVAELDQPEEPEVHHHTPARQKSSESLHSQGTSASAQPGKAMSSQTNASARPSRNKKSDVDPEEAAALEAALAERNAAKERHKQLKQAKNGEPVETSEPPKIVAPSKPTPPAEGNPGKAALSTKAVIAQKTAVDMVAGAIDAAVTPREKPQPAAEPAQSSKSPEKSPAKLLPPSEAQRQQQMEEDKKAAAKSAKAAAKSAKAEKVAKDAAAVEPEVEMADVEREKAATHVQRVARGRLARKGTQVNETTKKDAVLGAKAAKEESSENTAVTEEDSEAERRRKAAIEVQKMARGKITRKNAKSKSAKNSPRADETSAEADGPAAASVEVAGGGAVETAVLEKSASAAKVSIEATPSPFGPGYTEALSMES